MRKVKRGIKALRMRIVEDKKWTLKFVYEPDKERMIKALRVLLNSNGENKPLK